MAAAPSAAFPSGPEGSLSGVYAMNAATFHCLQQGQPAAGGYYGGAVDDDEDSGSEDDVIDVLSADHCTGEHSYTM